MITFASNFIKFGKDSLRELYVNGSTTDRQYRLQPQIVKKYQRVVVTLKSVVRIEDLYRFNALHFEALHGDKEGLYSVRINDQYRIEFTLNLTESEPVVTVCTIEELSKHYK